MPYLGYERDGPLPPSPIGPRLPFASSLNIWPSASHWSIVRCSRARVSASWIDVLWRTSVARHKERSIEHVRVMLHAQVNPPMTSKDCLRLYVLVLSCS